MYNQRPWKSGPVICEKCQCHGHATECQYDPIVDEEKSSLDIYGTYSGGGICINCSVSYIGFWRYYFQKYWKPLFILSSSISISAISIKKKKRA